MARQHPVGRTDIVLGQLADELTAALGVGRSVLSDGVTLRVVDDRGNALDVDAATVARVIAEHRPTPTPPPPHSREALAEALAGAVTVEDLRAALLAWARPRPRAEPFGPPR